MANPMLKDLFAFLTQDTAVAAIIGMRCYPMSLPQSPTFPALTYNQISANRVRAVEGPAGKVRRQVSINSWARNTIGVWLLADTVRVALDGFDGMMGDTEVGSTILKLEMAFFEESAGTVGIHRVLQDYQIGHKET